MDNSESIVKKIAYTRIFQRTRDAKPFVIINVGGARSGKSYAIMQLLISKLVSEKNKKIGICRKTFPALRMTTMMPFIDLLKDYGLYRDEWHNKSFNTYTYGTNVVQFFSLDEPDKIKSMEFNYVWMEEANEFTYEDYVALKLRLSGKCEPGEANHLYISLNPVDSQNWIPTRAALESDVEIIKSTYLDNPFLPESYVKQLTDLIHQDEASYRIYVLGEWGKLEGKIFSNIKVIPELPDMTGALWCYGLDYGLVNPSAIAKVYILNDKVYAEEVMYRPGLTVRDIIHQFTHLDRGDIFADPTAKQMTMEVLQSGLNAFDGHKGVKETIDLLQRVPIYIPESSVHLISEMRDYRWRKDPNKTGEEGYLSEPVKLNDHLVDCLRYARWGLMERYGMGAVHRAGEVKVIHTLESQGNSNKSVLDRWMKRNG